MDHDADGETAPSMPLAADRPVVDGTHRSSDEIRAELQELLAEDRRAEDRADEQRADEQRADEQRAEEVGDRKQAIAPAPVPSPSHTVAVQRKPGVLAAVAVVVVVVLLIRRRWSSTPARSGRSRPTPRRRRPAGPRGSGRAR